MSDTASTPYAPDLQDHVRVKGWAGKWRIVTIDHAAKVLGVAPIEKGPFAAPTRYVRADIDALVTEEHAMTDTAQGQTAPLPPVVTPGNQTSEYKLTMIVVLGGALLTIAGSVFTAIPSSHAPWWSGLVLVGIGSASAVLKAGIYTLSRGQVKAAALGGQS